MKRGDVVIVDYAREDPGADVRPAVIVQNDHDNSRLQKTIAVQITSNTRHSNEETNLLIDESHPDWKASGLEHPSLITCGNIHTTLKDDVVNVIGTLSAMTMNQLDECLKSALAIP